MAMKGSIAEFLRAAVIPVVWTFTSIVLMYAVLDTSPYIGLVSFDAGNFILASHTFNIAADQPHFPGFPGVVALTTILDSAFGPAWGLRVLNLLVPLSAFILGSVLHKAIGWQRTWLVQAIVLTSPLVWFFSFTAETYSIDLLAGTIVSCIAFTNRGVRWLPAVIGVTALFRPTTAALLLPGVIWVMWTQRLLISKAQIIAPLIIAAIAIGSAIAGIVIGAHGIDGLVSILTSAPPVTLHLFGEITPLLLYSLWLVVPLSGLVVYALIRPRAHTGMHMQPLVAVTIVPILFFVVVHYAKGYLLLLIAPIVIVLCVVWRAPQWLLALTVVAQTLVFLLMPSLPDPLPTTRSLAGKNHIARVFQRATSSYSCTLARLNDQRKTWDVLVPWLRTQHGPVFFHSSFAPPVRIAQALMTLEGQQNIPWWGSSSADASTWFRYDTTGVHQHTGLSTALKLSTIMTRDIFDSLATHR